MVRIPTTPRVEQVAAFPEPDHATEFAAQTRYETAREGWAWAYVGVNEPSLQQPQGADQPSVIVKMSMEEIAAKYPTAVPPKLSAALVERGAQEREKLRLWRKGGEKGPRPETPAIERLGERPGCTAARSG